MKELSIERMEMVSGGANTCSNIGNGIAISALAVSALALATGPVGWLAVASFGLSYAGVAACQLGLA